ncbi:hypothetical protein CJ030_MR2G013652 [Morella rubra]|uniref:Regulation of nuclear pre-mRNA domain-containing protein 1B n=1 Tax=Morella rubra TaxID=262757 RepID=A0A6A1WE12_9ROSI|nr:hypothetical protein CJ030_MR2G013652 [Morella rubra]
MDQAINIRMRLTSHTVRGSPATAANPTTEATKVVEQNLLSVQHANTMPQPLPTQPSVSFAPLRTTEEENKKAAAAAVAAKLAASTSSAQMLTSVLSSLVAEEAASMNGSINSTRFSSALSMFSPEKRPKLEKPMSVSDVNSSDINSTSYFTPLQQQPVSTAPPASSTGLQSLSQANQMQGPFAALPPPPPPPPPLSPAAPPANQYGQPAGLVVMPYGYGANTLPPPPPLPPHVALSLTRPAPQPPGQPQPQQPQQQQQPASGGFYRPPGIGFYGQSHQPTTPPVPRQ